MYKVGDILVFKNRSANQINRRIKEVITPSQDESETFLYEYWAKTYVWEYADLPSSTDNEFYSGNFPDPHLNIEWELEVKEEE